MTMLFEPWKQFQHSAVRQLAFSIASPNILSNIPPELSLQHVFDLHPNGFWQQQYENYHPSLLELDQNPQPLIDFLSQLKSTRLGLRFEYLMWFWLQDDMYHHFKLIGHSIQIIQEKQTLGELDFLLFNTQTQQVEHWEVALKYYLAEANLSLPHWYGLNRTDTLQRKLNHFTQKQFQFETVQDHSIQKRFAVLKGQLYLPTIPKNILDNDYLALNIPTWVNQARNIGYWGHQILQPNYYRLQRQEWICHDATLSSPPAYWWSNGLYKSTEKEQFYMFRQASFICLNVEQL